MLYDTQFPAKLRREAVAGAFREGAVPLTVGQGACRPPTAPIRSCRAG